MAPSYRSSMFVATIVALVCLVVVIAPTPSSAVLPINPNYNPAVANLLFWHSVTAYCRNVASIVNWSCNSCAKFGAFTVTATAEDAMNQGYVGYFTQGLPASPLDGASSGANAYVVISFRGTVTNVTGDIGEDADEKLVNPYPGVAAYSNLLVHHGFWTAYMSLKPQILAGVQTALAHSNAKTILVTGHSLGAAMAQLAALDLVLNNYPHLNFAAYTQGTPRMGNQALADLYSSRMTASFREVHSLDIIPHVPLVLSGYAHARTEVWFQEDWSSYTVCADAAGSGEVKTCSNAVLDTISIPRSVSDHIVYRGYHMGGYCNGMTEHTVLPVSYFKEWSIMVDG